jgi:RES domain-containing protein
MAHTLWRIAADTPDYGADDLSGKGAANTGGRWNREGTALLYTSGTIALACLETIVHLTGSRILPLNRYLVRFEATDEDWMSREVFDHSVQIGWDSEPAGLVSLDAGTRWAESERTLILEVPSIVVPEESNYLLNPRHGNAEQLKARKVRRWSYDTRLR